MIGVLIVSRNLDTEMNMDIGIMPYKAEGRDWGGASISQAIPKNIANY